MTGPQRIAAGVHPVIATICQTIRDRRMSLTSFAAEAGLERANLHKWFTSTHQPTLRSMEAAANVLGLGVGLAPLDAQQRAHAMAEYLLGQGWSVEPPQTDQDARAASPAITLPPDREKPWQGPSTGRQKACGEAGR